jgi:multicomponent Na+:H+ antiporter subunit E
MKTFVWNVVLAVAWAAMTRITPLNLIVGFAVGYLVLWASPGSARRTSYFRKVGQALRFALFFTKELVVSTLRISYDVLTPTHHMRPAVVGIPLEPMSNTEIATLAIVITLTPGTMALDVSRDRRTLYIHAMYVPDVEALRAEIKQGFERRVLELLR